MSASVIGLRIIWIETEYPVEVIDRPDKLSVLQLENALVVEDFGKIGPQPESAIVVVQRIGDAAQCGVQIAPVHQGVGIVRDGLNECIEILERALLQACIRVGLATIVPDLDKPRIQPEGFIKVLDRGVEPSLLGERVTAIIVGDTQIRGRFPASIDNL